MQLIIDNAGCEKLHSSLRSNEPDGDDVLGKENLIFHLLVEVVFYRREFTVCEGALELLTMCLILNKNALDTLNNDNIWPHFLIDLILLSDNR